MHERETSRRDFLKTSALTVGAAAGALGAIPAVHAAGADTIKVGLIGCGGRGSGAASNVLHAAKGVEIYAIGDYFKEDDKRGVLPCRNSLMNIAKEDKVKELGNTVNLPDERCFTGLEAYKKVIGSGVDYIILATPPGFRPMHLEAAVAAGKHVFTEKPVAVDGPGIRKVLDVYKQAQAKKLGIGAGTQRRHQTAYQEAMKRVQDGAIGDIVSARAYWNQGDIWFRSRPNGMTDLDYQIHNWYHFVWLCGDHICEQHVHNLDVVNWATGKVPVSAFGMGGRVRPCSDPNVDGHIYNFFAVEYEYPNGVHVHSTCRQVANTDGNVPGIAGVSEALVGTKGTCSTADRRIYQIKSDKEWTFQPKNDNLPYIQEHTDLIESIRAGKPINELKNVAESTMTAILGRMVCYTGKTLTWEQALNSKQETMPAKLEAAAPSTPPVAVPGQTKFV